MFSYQKEVPRGTRTYHQVPDVFHLDVEETKLGEENAEEDPGEDENQNLSERLVVFHCG